MAAKILAARRPSRWLRLRNPVCRALAALVVFVTAFQLIDTFLHVRWAPAETVMSAVAPFEIINTYGLFAVMTTSRPEIVIEGSADGVTWLAYEFKYKPGELTRRPAWVEPYQPRLDWQMWFAALGDYQSDPWTVQLMAKLLDGSPAVLVLFGKNPFPGSPPRYVRALLYEYRFTTPAGTTGYRRLVAPGIEANLSAFLVIARSASGRMSGGKRKVHPDHEILRCTHGSRFG